MLTISSQVNLTQLNTLGLQSVAAKCVTVSEVSDLPQLGDSLAKQPWFVLGSGSNVVLPLQYDGVVVRPAFKGIECLSGGDCPSVKAYAGENWHDFVGYCLQQGWLGLENLALIPGTVGAAPIQNIGAYGLEVAQRIESVCIWDCAHQCLRDLPVETCGFSYRDSIFKRGELGQVIVVSVTFKLFSSSTWQPVVHYADLAKLFGGEASRPPVTAENIYEQVIAIRKHKLPDPDVLGNAGSFFKNPVVSQGIFDSLKRLHPLLPNYAQIDGTVKLAAAWLIDQCDLKGVSCGPIAVHSNQALVLVNTAGTGKANAQDVVLAMQWVQRAVFDRFNVALEAEPIFV